MGLLQVIWRVALVTGMEKWDRAPLQMAGVPTVIELSRFEFEALRKGQRSILYRGRSKDNSSQILVLSPVAKHPSAESLKLMAHEYSLREKLDARWTARPRAISRHLDRTVLVLEDPGGLPLIQLLGHPSNLAFSLRLAINLAVGIGQLHQRDIIHKNIKPANILVNSATGQTWLTGFGIASQLPRERQSSGPPDFIAGTLAYMAPEQTGRMNRSIDSRSDLYSLGVTLYEMLTGVLPFDATDPMEWVHCHVARQAPPITERVERIPEAISAIVSKLLAKHAAQVIGETDTFYRVRRDVCTIGAYSPYSFRAS
jgi:serine/threonine protein kinase